MRSLLLLLLLSASLSLANAQTAPLWLRYPAISPDGRTIAFNYKGDIYTVPSSGGQAAPLTLSESYEVGAVWSPDGKLLAFSSDRYGNFDVFVMPATGGEARRLTYHSSREMPSAFSSDSKSVLFSGLRQDLATHAQFPVGGMNELYRVSTAGGRVELALPVPAVDATLSPDGSKIIFHDWKGYEDNWRKHHTSAVTRDIFMYDTKTNVYTQLSQWESENRNPVFDANGTDFYYLNERSGTFNVVKSSVSNPTQVSAITQFTKHPVRFLSRALDNTLCFSYDGQIYTLKPGGQPQLVSIAIATDGRTDLDKNVPVNGGFTEAALSPNGKEYAYIFRGEVFVSSVEGGVTKRITNTPYQERSVGFSPDGRTLVFAAEKDNNWNLYSSSINRAEEPYFYASTVLKRDVVIATEAEEFQPSFSPDGKEVAYLEDRVKLKVVNLATKQSRLILPADKNYSYSDGDQFYQWSPDGKWFAVQYGPAERIWWSEVGLVSADGKGQVINLTQSGYNDYAPKWALDGKVILYGNDRDGLLDEARNNISTDVYALFLSKAAYDRMRLSKEELALVKEAEEKAKKAATSDDKKPAASTPKDSSKAVAIDWANLTDRKLKLSTHVSSVADQVLSKDGEKLFYLTRFEKGLDLWVTDIRAKESKPLARLGAERASMELSKDGKFIFLLVDGKASKVDAESGKVEALTAKGEMVLRAADERAYIYDHAWRQLKQKFYVADIHGVNWDMYYAEYRKFLPHISNNHDFAEMLSELLGETNASHTGCRYRYTPPNTDQTASLGLMYDYEHTGIGARIAEVIEGGPLDRASAKLRAGDIIEQIDGEALSPSVDIYQLLNRKADKLTLLSLYNPTTKARWEETVKPISLGDENELLYKRWVRTRRAEVERLSGGKIGYVHVRGMNDASLRTVIDEALGKHISAQAVIVDTRFNGGGNIHEQLSDFLSGKAYVDIIPHGQYIGSEPLQKWTKPSIVLVNESCYSDAHLFPLAYRTKGIGKTLGMPVPGTGTFVWWETQIDPTLVFGIPMGGWKMREDGKFAENNQFEPDIKIPNPPDLLSRGRDQQLEAAVAELLKQK